jgi:hypothetical protein
MCIFQTQTGGIGASQGVAGGALRSNDAAPAPPGQQLAYHSVKGRTPQKSKSYIKNNNIYNVL